MTDLLRRQADNAFSRAAAATLALRPAHHRELGYPNFDVNPWRASTPPPSIANKLNADVAEILRAPETQTFLKDQGSNALVMSLREFHELLVSDVEKWA